MSLASHIAASQQIIEEENDETIEEEESEILTNQSQIQIPLEVQPLIDPEEEKKSEAGEFELIKKPKAALANSDSSFSVISSQLDDPYAINAQQMESFEHLS